MCDGSQSPDVFLLIGIASLQFLGDAIIVVVHRHSDAFSELLTLTDNHQLTAHALSFSHVTISTGKQLFKQTISTTGWTISVI